MCLKQKTEAANLTAYVGVYGYKLWAITEKIIWNLKITQKAKNNKNNIYTAKFYNIWAFVYSLKLSTMTSFIFYFLLLLLLLPAYATWNIYSTSIHNVAHMHCFNIYRGILQFAELLFRLHCHCSTPTKNACVVVVCFL